MFASSCYGNPIDFGLCAAPATDDGSSEALQFYVVNVRTAGVTARAGREVGAQPTDRRNDVTDIVINITIQARRVGFS